tara:strand:- start:539 stop:1081 length:543 start_codon:yes stop_codon:yes gene_type:complete
MNIVSTPIEGLVVFEPKVFLDDRGYFFESWNENFLKQYGLELQFVQDNQSSSKKNVLRGLHFQNPPHEQGKLVRVVKGKVLDVVVDIRKDSVTYGRSFSIELSEYNKIVFWIPPGFAHGFLSLEDDTIFCYKCTGEYNKKSEGNLLWNDPNLDIDWGIDNPIISEKDLQGINFTDFISQF